MATPEPTPAEIRAEKLAEIERINRILSRGVSEVREEDRGVKHDLKLLYRRRDELLAEVGSPGAQGSVQTGRIRQVRIIGRKGL